MTSLVVRTDADNLAEAGGAAPSTGAATVGHVVVERARRGDRTAQAALFEQFQDVWYRFCMSILGDAEWACEAVQETALRFLQRLAGFRGDSELKTWALGIALNVCRELARKRNRPVDSETLAARRSPAGPGPDAAAANAEQHERVRELVDQLSPRQREAVGLRYFEQMNVDETARVMACAPGTVKATLAQALQKLRRAYGDQP